MSLTHAIKAYLLPILSFSSVMATFEIYPQQKLRVERSMSIFNFGVSMTILNLVGGASWTLDYCKARLNPAIFLKEERQIDNILSFCTHFLEKLTGNDILFSMTKCFKEVNTFFTGYFIKQHDTVEYSKLNSEALASKSLGKINPKLKFLYRKSKYLTSAFRSVLCNALI